ncbi:molybdopterin-dependent oxidoreductase [Castellaniella denitrificans]|uniref:molybdopterin-dependent oxidoreductase n=1 Tax=Castellaniella denitrificans TaxID=56119 RepID=UPI001AD13797|nr:molybdopterin-dependent oxidoreductase [Burkholderiales bacterium]
MNAFPRRKPQALRGRRHRRVDGRRLVLLGGLYLVLLAAVAVLVAAFIHPREIAVHAQSESPGKIVLTVESQGRRTRFDMRALEALPQRTYKVTTPWYLRPVSFQGPLLRDVLAAAGAHGTHIEAVAVNDYTADIPFEHAEAYDVIIALRMDGKPMSPRDKGPLFVVYPYDRLPLGMREKSFDLSVWQLDGLRVR